MQRADAQLRAFIQHIFFPKRFSISLDLHAAVAIQLHRIEELRNTHAQRDIGDHVLFHIDIEVIRCDMITFYGHLPYAWRMIRGIRAAVFYDKQDIASLCLQIALYTALLSSKVIAAIHDQILFIDVLLLQDIKIVCRIDAIRIIPVGVLFIKRRAAIVECQIEMIQLIAVPQIDAYLCREDGIHM